MSGKRYLLDTNAIIQLLLGNPVLLAIVAEADFLATSVICKLEFLSYSKLDETSRVAFLEFLSRIILYDVANADAALARETVKMRMTCSLKLPDAIIAATALVNDCEIVTNDAHFQKQSRVAVKTYALT